MPKGVKVEHHEQTVKITGPLGTAELSYDPCLTVKIEDAGSRIDVVNPQPEVRHNKELHGTTRALIANMIVGVTQGYQKKMEIYGTGYNVKEQGGKLVLQVGFAHLVEMPIPKGVKVTIDVAATRGNEVPAKFALVRRGQVHRGPVRRGDSQGQAARSLTRARGFGTRMSISDTRSARRLLQVGHNREIGLAYGNWIES